VTAIVGLVDNGRVLLGGDSAGVNSHQLTVRRDTKTFTNGPFVFGFTDSFRMGQILRYAFTPPAPPADVDLDAFMCTTFIDGVRQALLDGRWARVDQAQVQGGVFLVGVAGRLFRVDGDFQVGEPLDGYDAVGCGEDFALGALHATAGAGMPAGMRVLTALKAAERHCAGVRGPFTLACQPE
jgi:hypothetical protein